MRRIIRKHTWPVKRGRSYYLSPDLVYNEILVQNSTYYPDRIRPHRSIKDRWVYLKYYNRPIGIHGSTGRYCYTIVVIIQHKKGRNRIVTAYPSL